MKVIKHYFYFYMTVAVLYTLWSYLIDLILYRGSLSEYDGKWVSYFFWFVLVYTLNTILISTFYNLLINLIFKDVGIWVRIAVAIAFGLFISWVLGDSGLNYIVGPLAKTKVILLYPLIGVSVEIIRTCVVKQRYKNYEEIT